MAEDALDQISRFYDQMRRYEQEQGPSLQTIEGRGETLEALIRTVAQPPPEHWFSQPLGHLRAVPLVPDDGIPAGIVRLVYSDGSVKHIRLRPEGVDLARVIDGETVRKEIES